MCVTNRKLCQEDFLGRIRAIARASYGRIGGIILREKDLPEAEYRELARKVMEICGEYGVRCILHNFAGTAVELGAQAIHLPLPVLRSLRGSAALETQKARAADKDLDLNEGCPEMQRADKDSDLNEGCLEMQRADGRSRSVGAGRYARMDLSRFQLIGASCHSVEDALEAQALGCTYITAGHVFATDCKKGVPPRGLAFLREVCESVSIPVYAIGGINQENYPLVLQAGAAGACIMSGLMCCGDVEEYMGWKRR